MKLKKTDKRVIKQTSLLSLVRILFIALWTIIISLIGDYFFNRKSKAEASQIYQKLGRYWAVPILAVCNVQLEIKGIENVKNKRGMILTPNHMSHFDTLIMLAVLRDIPFRFVYKKELLSVPIFGKVLGKSESIAIDRENTKLSTIRTIMRRLKSGLNLVMFPEGTSGYEDIILPFKDGPFIIASQLGIEIVPVVIRGSRRVYGKSYPRLISAGKVSVEIFSGIRVERDKIKGTAKETHDFVEAKYWEVV